MTYEEFLAWSDEDTWAEWVDGEVIILMPPNIPHQRIVAFLLTTLRLFTGVFDLGEVLTAPTQMRLRATRSGREPDLLFVAKAHLSRVLHNLIDGPADLVVEVVSPESVKRDRQQKFREYETAGVREYWLIDPDRRSAEFYGLDADGRFRPMPVDAGVFRSAVVPGFWLRLDWLWQQPPRDLAALRELGLLQADAASE
jgi:Uma2 family endonuclease